jgi:hypothetical protein
MIPLLIMAGAAMAASAAKGVAESAAAKNQYSANYRSWQEQELDNTIKVRQQNRQIARQNAEARIKYRNEAISAFKTYDLSMVAIREAAYNDFQRLNVSYNDMAGRQMAVANAKNIGGNSGTAEAFRRAAAMSGLNAGTNILMQRQSRITSQDRRLEETLKAREFVYRGPITYIPGAPPAAPDTNNIMFGNLLQGGMAAGGMLAGGLGGGVTDVSANMEGGANFVGPIIRYSP